MQFVDVLREHNVSYFTEGKHCRPGWVQFHCPFCFGRKDPEKPYAGYCIAYHYVNCWACGPHGVAKTIVALTGVTWREVKTLLDDLDIPRRTEERHTGKLVLPEEVGPLLRCHKDYLRGRGFNTKYLATTWRVQGIGLASRLAWRIFIPIYWRGRIVSWTTRSLEDSGTRYISASEDEEAIPHKTLLYGEDFATNAISVHEGPIDAWRVGVGAVATLGTGYSSAQVLRMSRYPRRIICFDSEKAAQQRARKLVSLLKVFPGETINVVLDAKDAGSAKEKEIKQLRDLLR